MADGDDKTPEKRLELMYEICNGRFIGGEPRCWKELMQAAQFPELYGDGDVSMYYGSVSDFPTDEAAFLGCKGIRFKSEVEENKFVPCGGTTLSKVTSFLATADFLPHWLPHDGSVGLDGKPKGTKEGDKKGEDDGGILRLVDWEDIVSNTLFGNYFNLWFGEDVVSCSPDSVTITAPYKRESGNTKVRCLRTSTSVFLMVFFTS